MTVKCPACPDGKLNAIKIKQGSSYASRVSYKGSVLGCDTCGHKEVFR